MWKVGLTTLPWGLVNAIVAVSSGRVIQYTGRLPIITAGAIVDMAAKVSTFIS